MHLGDHWRTDSAYKTGIKDTQGIPIDPATYAQFATHTHAAPEERASPTSALPNLLNDTRCKMQLPGASPIRFCPQAPTPMSTKKLSSRLVC